MAEGPVFPVAFDELAMAEDLARLSRGGAEAFAAFGREVERRDGLPRERLLAAMRKAATVRDLAAASRRTSRGRRVVSAS